MPTKTARLSPTMSAAIAEPSITAVRSKNSSMRLSSAWGPVAEAAGTASCFRVRAAKNCITFAVVTTASRRRVELQNARLYAPSARTAPTPRAVPPSRTRCCPPDHSWMPPAVMITRSVSSPSSWTTLSRAGPGTASVELRGPLVSMPPVSERSSTRGHPYAKYMAAKVTRVTPLLPQNNRLYGAGWSAVHPEWDGHSWRMAPL
mmetsp:Transcript_9295/g.27932  ORF Transcript_9295/g.27932 Transcript_9295/m.27932 type:complete len:204 (-) Transcript_9295:430-1041(-)